MKRLVLFVVSMFSVSAMGAWVKVFETESTVTYIEPNNIRRNGDIVRFWQLTDSRRKLNDGSLSSRVQLEIDCREERRRFLYQTAYAGQMATGNVIFTQDYSSDSGAVSPIAPGTVGWEVFKLICK